MSKLRADGNNVAASETTPCRLPCAMRRRRTRAAH